MRKLRLQLVLSGVIVLTAALLVGFAKEESGEFSSHRISMGMIVADLDKSVDFYTNVLGMQMTSDFAIDTKFGSSSGLTDGKAFSVKLLKLVDNEHATELKLMSFGNKANHPFPKYIHDDTGVQYLTIFVNSMTPFLQRIKKNRIDLLGETPIQLNDGRQFILIQDPDGTFIELIGLK
jgi:catechol 2,3-dioxygenase-like lactoylglutathione lyase family enzyme